MRQNPLVLRDLATPHNGDESPEELVLMDLKPIRYGSSVAIITKCMQTEAK